MSTPKMILIGVGFLIGWIILLSFICSSGSSSKCGSTSCLSVASASEAPEPNYINISCRVFADSPITITSGDFDGDGKIDLAVAVHGWRTDGVQVYILKNDGKGNFSK